MNSRFFIGLSVVVLAGAVCGSALKAQQAVSISSGVYTADQAKRGQAVYADACSKCHLEDLSGGTSPPLAGNEFLSAWKGRTVGALFDQVKMTMPFDNPGGLMPAQYADVVAFMLSANKFPAGDKELSSEPASLQQITIDAEASK
jgi:S-disulfanyl-L-cysteine oxidoreductase SoxD